MEEFITDERTGLRYELVGDYYLIAGEAQPGGPPPRFGGPPPPEFPRAAVASVAGAAGSSY